MKRKFTSILAPVLAFLVMWMGVPLDVAYADESAQDGPAITEASAWAICDQNGTFLAENNADQELPPASITKIMTAMIVLDSNLSFAEDVEIPNMPSSWVNAQLAGLKPGSRVNVWKLFDLMLIHSANDAAYTLAVAVSGSESEFCNLMNAKASEIGMTHTHFACSSGMDEPDHYASAHDLCVMGLYAYQNYPMIRSTVVKPYCSIEIDGEEYVFENSDELLRSYPYACGMKTGASDTSFTFLGAARKNEALLIDCVLGCSTLEGRFVDAQALFEWAYAHCFKTCELGLADASLGYRRFAFHYGIWLEIHFTSSQELDLPLASNVHTLLCESMSQTSLVLPNKTYAEGAHWYVNGELAASQAVSTGSTLVVHPTRNFLLPLFMQP